MPITSRLRPAPGPRHYWTSAEGVTIELPVIVEWLRTDDGGRELSRVDVRVDLGSSGRPELMSVTVQGPDGLDPVELQRNFRWLSPLVIVTVILPSLIAIGEDPYAVALPVTGFPAVAAQPIPVRGSLTDEFLRVIAAEYLVRGRGYARSIARDYQVSERTAVSWVEKARARGILTAPPSPGSVGGELLD